jgi:hypothetical protein
LRDASVAASGDRRRQGWRRRDDAVLHRRIIPPRRERPIRFDLPPIRSAADLSAAMEAITSAVAQGELTTGEAWEISQIIDTFIRAIDASEFASQLARLETAAARQAKDAREP